MTVTGDGPLHGNYGPEARNAVEREAQLPTTGREREVARGLPAADSVVDRRIPTFSRGELPHFAGINTFLKAPFAEDVRTCGEYDVVVLGARRVSQHLDERMHTTPRFPATDIPNVPPRNLVQLGIGGCSPPYDHAEITSLIATRVICDPLGCLVRAGHLPRPAGE